MRVIATYPGRFHPFHKGHAASFKQLAQKFGLDNTYLAISAKQEQPKSPFSAKDRARMAMALGIPSKNIISVRNPYAAQEYIDQLKLDPEHTALVFGVSKKDMEGDPELGIAPDPRFSFAPKRDGSPSYLQQFNPKKVDPLSQHGYVMSTDVAEFPIAGKNMRDASAIRKAYAGADEKTKMKILKDLYGDAAEKMKQVFDNNLQVTESIRRLIAQIKPMLTEATIEQKAKFVKLLSEAKKTMISESGHVWSKGQAGIIKDLGNGYFLGDDSYDDDEGFTKEGWSVYYQVGPNEYKHLDHVRVSPYRMGREPGEVEKEINRIINQHSQNEVDEEANNPVSGKMFSDDSFERFASHPQYSQIAAYAKHHYPESPDAQVAFLKFVARSLMHSKDDDQRQDNEIELLMKRVNSLQDAIDKIKDKKNTQSVEKIDESTDYLEEK